MNVVGVVYQSLRKWKQMSRKGSYRYDGTAITAEGSALSKYSHAIPLTKYFLPCTILTIIPIMADTPRSSSRSPSRSSTPNPRFTSQSHSAEDLLKEQTVGLVHLSDFRKRRAEAMEQLSRDGTPMGSGATTPDGR